MKVTDATSYDHTEAYDSLVRLVNDFATSGGRAAAADLTEFVHRIRAI